LRGGEKESSFAAQEDEEGKEIDRRYFSVSVTSESYSEPRGLTPEDSRHGSGRSGGVMETPKGAHFLWADGGTASKQRGNNHAGKYLSEEIRKNTTGVDIDGTRKKEK